MGLLGFLGKAAGALTGLGQIAGGGAQGASDERLNENQQRLAQNQLLAQLFNTRQNAQSNALQGEEAGKLNRAGLDLSRRNFSLNAPSTQARQAAIGSLLQHIQPATMSGLSSRVSSRMPTISSPLSALGPDARQAGALLSGQALEGLRNPAQFEDIAPTDFQSGVLTPPQMAALEGSGMLEKILGGAGLAGSILGGVGQALPKKSEFMTFDFSKPTFTRNT